MSGGHLEETGLITPLLPPHPCLPSTSPGLAPSQPHCHSAFCHLLVKPSQLNCVYLNYTGNHSVDDARQALALLVNSTDLPLLAFSVPAFFPTQELEGEKKRKKRRKTNNRRERINLKHSRSGRTERRQIWSSCPSHLRAYEQSMHEKQQTLS